MSEDWLRNLVVVGHVHYKLVLTACHHQHLLCHFSMLRKLSTVEAWTSIQTPFHCIGPCQIWFSPPLHSFFAISVEFEAEMVFKILGQKNKVNMVLLTSTLHRHTRGSIKAVTLKKPLNFPCWLPESVSSCAFILKAMPQTSVLEQQNIYVGGACGCRFQYCKITF